MALNIQTDKVFDSALSWLAKVEKKSKSEIVRASVLNLFRLKKSGFQFGAFSDVEKGKKSKMDVVSVLKKIDQDHDLY